MDKKKKNVECGVVVYILRKLSKTNAIISFGII